MSDGAAIRRDDPEPDRLDFLAGGGEMSALIRAHNWASTPLGPIAMWPQSLRTTVSLCLSSTFPINIIWGPEHTQIYNDGYRIVCGDVHPRALGENYSVTWASAWPAIGESFERALAGERMYTENRRMYLKRLHGALEETFFTFSHSPVRDESGGIGGLFHPVTETTANMLAERRTRALRDLAASLGAATDEAEVARRAVESLSHFEFDLPFLLYYALDPNTASYRLTAHHGIAPGRPVTPSSIERDATGPWPFAEALAALRIVDVDHLPSILRGEPCGPYEEPPHRGFVVPIVVPGTERPPAVIVTGASSRLRLNADYRSFYDLLGVTVSGAVATVRAREDERRRAEALAEIDRAKTLFFSNVSHEFRTPLTLMLGPLEETLRSHSIAGQQREQLTIAHRNSLRLLKLVNSLLEFSRVEAGRAQASYRATDISELTAELASNFRSACERAGLRLVVNCPALPEPVYVDRDMWEKVVLNLVSNAFKFTFEGEIAVSVLARNGWAELTVRDTGTGIPEIELPRLFERFHRIENARSRTHEGTGIGLALVQELVKLHGGSVEAASTYGEGTTFTVRVPLGTAHLPADRIDADKTQASTATRAEAYVEEALRWLPGSTEAPPLDASSDAAAPATVRSDRAHVLFADDNADMRDYVRRLLEGRHEVEAVADGQAALDAARAHRPDLLLADVMMPRLDGFGLLRALRDDQVLKDVPVVLLSARAGDEAKLEGLDAGADDYLTKPFSARELIGRVNANLELARIRRQATAAVRESEERYRSLVNASSYAIYRMSPDWSEMRELHGRDFIADTPLPSRTWLDRYIHPDDQPLVTDAIKEAIRTRSVFELEHRIWRVDGTLGWTLSRAVPLVDENGEVTEWFGAASDVTKRRHAEDQQALLLREMSHRINNLFAVTSGLVMLSARSASTPQELAAAVRERLSALSRAHELTRPGLIGVSVKATRDATLHALIRAIFAPYADERPEGREAVVLAGLDVPISGQAVTNVALVLHELATNAAKYGALSVESGSIHIDCSVDGDRLRVTWKERGGPQLDNVPESEGFGSLLSRTIVDHQFGGQLSRHWEPDGVLVHLSVPLDALRT